MSTQGVAGNEIPPESMEEFLLKQREYGQGLVESANYGLGRLKALAWLGIKNTDEVLINAAETQAVAEEVNYE